MISKAADWLRDLWRRNVKIESLPITNGLTVGDEDRSYLPDGKCVATIRLYDSGDFMVASSRGMELQATHIRGLNQFLASSQ